MDVIKKTDSYLKLSATCDFIITKKEKEVKLYK